MGLSVLPLVVAWRVLNLMPNWCLAYPRPIASELSFSWQIRAFFGRTGCCAVSISNSYMQNHGGGRMGSSWIQVSTWMSLGTSIAEFQFMSGSSTMKHQRTPKGWKLSAILLCRFKPKRASVFCTKCRQSWAKHVWLCFNLRYTWQIKTPLTTSNVLQRSDFHVFQTQPRPPWLLL